MFYVSADIPCAGVIASQCDYKCARLDGVDTCICKPGLRLKENSTYICQGRIFTSSTLLLLKFLMWSCNSYRGK